MTITGMEDWVAKGCSALAVGNLTDAQKYLETAVKRDPLNAAVHNKLSVVHWKLGNLEASLHHLTQALEWDPNDKEIVLHCCEVFRAVGREQDAKEILDAYLERNPSDTQLRDLRNAPSVSSVPLEKPFDAGQFFLEQGEQQFEKGNREHARVCFEMALEHNPNCAKAFSNLGVLSWHEGDLETALEHLHKALELDPQDTDVIYNSSRALTAAGELEMARDLLRLYLQRNPKDENGWQEYEALLKQNGASQWHPDGLTADVAEIYLRMGEALADAKDTLGAGQAFSRAIQLDPAQVEPYYQLGCLHLGLGQEEEALAILREGLRLHPEHEASLVMAGRLLAGQGHMEEVRTLCEAYASRQADADAGAILAEILDVAGPQLEQDKTARARPASQGGL